MKLICGEQIESIERHLEAVLTRTLFADGLVPFELSSALLMVAVVGAVAVARGKQGVHNMSASSKSEPS